MPLPEVMPHHFEVKLRLNLREHDLPEWYLVWLELWDVAQKATHTSKILEGYCTRGRR